MDMMLEQFKTIFDRPEKIKKLRKTILDLAVRGKLAPQNPNDEPASVLLDRIKEEKEKLIKDKNIKREKPIKEISEDEKPFELPIGWQWARFNEIAYFNIGKTPSRKNSDFWDGEYFNWVSISDMKHNGYIESTKEMISSKAMEECFKGIFSPKGTLIMSFKLTIGKISILNIDAVHNEAIISIFPFEEKMKEYLFKGINGFDLTRGTNDAIMGKTLNSTSLKEIVIGIPPIEEQKRIVEKVDLLMDFCDKLEKALEKKVYYGELSAKSVFNSVGNVSSCEELEETLRFILLNFKELSLGDNAVKELKNCILQLAIQGKLVPQDSKDEPVKILLEKIKNEKDILVKEKKIKNYNKVPKLDTGEEPFIIPDTWKFIRLNDLLLSIDAGKSPACENRCRQGNEIGVIKTTAIQINKFLKNENKVIPDKFIINDEWLIRKDDILITRAGPKNRVGIVCLVVDNIEKLILSDKTVRLTVSNLFINKKYLCYALNSNVIRAEIEKYMTGMAESQVNISQVNMRFFPIPIPPLEEQERIVEKLEFLLKLCDRLEGDILKYRAYNNKLVNSIIKNI